ncbi:GntT/GntP/DsdX family permease [Kurthia sibirica]|uniref:2-keto-3-deoxygluconate permease n=1 Tax=Kurthia sibirica TaxID=202750 RepID=A0A2U3AJF1_9BACL|nr:gluconate:H+ symporter [Kurthia sibirica]PWI24696.1 2-keto-3-deoxygluconate permease [Kurthia sibirica]GEK34538.1 2-keto-3-deoxygluconate permease [Kurthia sibirica]
MDPYLLIITILSIVLVIVGVSVFKWHAFISLTVASLFLAIFAKMDFTQIVKSFETGVGGQLGHLIGILALGTMLGKLLAESGAGLKIANFFIKVFGEKKLPWAMFASGFIVGIPVFFEVGILILLPLIISIQQSTKKNILVIGLPAIAGLSIVHGLVPPHPGAVAAIGIYGADIGTVLLYSLIIAIPAGILGGPIFAKLITKVVKPKGEPDLLKAKSTLDDGITAPSTFTSFFIILLPVILMVIGTLKTQITSNETVQHILQFIGEPLIALLVAVFAATYLLGYMRGRDRKTVKLFLEDCLMPIGSIALIIGAGSGYKQILIDSGVGTMIGNMAQDMSLSPLILAFLIAGLIRVATGSATVALTTAAGIIAPIVATMPDVNLALLVIVTGAGSLMLSHVNDAGFWMVKEYLGLTLNETFKTWTLLETILSFTAFGMAMFLNSIL